MQVGLHLSAVLCHEQNLPGVQATESGGLAQFLKDAWHPHHNDNQRSTDAIGYCCGVGTESPLSSEHFHNGEALNDDLQSEIFAPAAG